ncbi:MAG: PP2C family protein-serine/threonine phosphatase [Balneolaceae bacterium]|nr:PP2C family protein-serine/threonine phosphatase [Balneolaceae bacterium]MCH8547454.1 PP2C family protein-serine/threonine phosphatase [Balneolaceae bacterium]
MSTFSDTTKQDWGLAIAGILAAALFYWFYSGLHPLSQADHSLGKAESAESSEALANQLGYETASAPIARFVTKTSLLDSLQKQIDLPQFLGEERNRLLYGPFYWENILRMGDPESDEFLLTRNSITNIDVRLNEQGDLLELINADRNLPDRVLDAELLGQVLDMEPVVFNTFPSDSTVLNYLSFDFNGEMEPGLLRPGGQTYFDRELAQAMGDQHLGRSAWAGLSFDSVSVEKTTVRSFDGAKVIYSSASQDVRQQPSLELLILPSGALISMELSYDEESAPEFGWVQIQSGIQAGILMIALFWVLALLIIRFRMRLIDLRAAILIAVLAGFIFPFFVVLQNSHEHFTYGGELTFRFVLAMLLTCGFIAAFSSVIYFLSTSISDSVTRQHWPEKLRSLDLIRLGYFVNKPVGLVFIRSVIYSFIIAGGVVLLYSLLPNGYVTIESRFYSDGIYLPSLTMILFNIAIYLVITQAIFLIGLGHLRSVIPSLIALVLITVLVFALMNPLYINMGPISTKLIVTSVAGLLAAIIYLKDDYLTTFLTLLFTAGHFSTATGWVVSASPDLNLFYTHLLLLTGVVGFGLYALRKGSHMRELPDFVPEYVEELAQDERMKQELQIARKVQQSFLPVRTPQFEGLDIAAICKPAYETGGDYYDFIEIDDHRLAVTIGDVSGKGIEAAFYMTFTKGVLHAICQDFTSSSELLAKTNKLFRNNASRGTFVSLIFGVADLKESTFRFSRAGHNPLLYYNSNEGKLHQYTPKGIGVGMACDQTFMKNITEQTISLKSGDILIMFTDGVVEATSAGNDFYGDERLHRLIEKYHDLTSDKLLKNVMDDLNSFSDMENPHDDMTMLIIKKK